MSFIIDVDLLENETVVSIEEDTLQVDFVDENVIQVDFFDCIMLNTADFELWLLSRPGKPNQEEAIADLGYDKIYYVTPDTDTDIPFVFKRTPPAP